jgi:hypothetical protein
VSFTIATLATDMASCSMRYEPLASPVTESDNWIEQALSDLWTM